MKAPDKIVLPAAAGEMQFFIDDTVYIRRDALLEWAIEMKRICKGAEPIEKAYQTMIEKIQSL